MRLPDKEARRFRAYAVAHGIALGPALVRLMDRCGVLAAVSELEQPGPEP